MLRRITHDRMIGGKPLVGGQNAGLWTRTICGDEISRERPGDSVRQGPLIVDLIQSPSYV